MIAEETSKPTLPQAPVRRNAGLHEAFWTRCSLLVVKTLPKIGCLALARPVSFVIYLLARPQRRALQANIGALQPSFGRVRRWWAGYQVILQFALTFLDRLWHMHLGREVAWDISDLSHFEQMRKAEGGVLIFTIHSGNYDIGASLFAQKLGRTLHIVRVPEKTEELQKLRAAELGEEVQKNPNLRVHYNQSAESHLGIELCRLLMAAEVVAVQGDRVVAGISPIELTHEGLTFKIPHGPLVLAEISRVPCFPIFLERVGCMHYRITIGAPFYDGTSKVRAEQLGQAWLPLMSEFVREHWDQWFVFEPLVAPAKMS